MTDNDELASIEVSAITADPLIRGDGIDWCRICLMFGPPTDAMATPIAVIPPRPESTWVQCRYNCRRCGYGWWRPWPRQTKPAPPPPPTKPRRNNPKNRARS